MVPRLAPHFRVVAPDLRGFGDSDKPGRSHWISARWQRTFWKWHRWLGYDNALVGGHGIGGRVVVTEHPEAAADDILRFARRVLSVARLGGPAAKIAPRASEGDSARENESRRTPHLGSSSGYSFSCGFTWRMWYFQSNYCGPTATPVDSRFLASGFVTE